MSVKVLIVEDEELYADKLEMQLEKLEYDHLGTVDNSVDALSLIDKQLPDLILMDVHIQGDYDGIELAGLVQQKQDIPIIFITSLKDDLTFKRASRTKPLAFLTKPFDELQLQRSIELAVIKLEPGNISTEKAAVGDKAVEVFTKSYFFVKHRQRLDKVLFEQIYYLEADGRYTQIITGTRKYLIRRPLQELTQRLPSDLFVQTHRSYVLNLSLVSSVDFQESVVYLGEVHVPLSRRNKDDFLSKLEQI